MTFRSMFGTGRYDPDKLARLLVGQRRLVQWRFYAGMIPGGLTDRRDAERATQLNFFAALRRNYPDGKLCLGRMQVVNGSGHIREKGIDVRIALDLLRLAVEDRYDTAILLSCDEDLQPAVDLVQQQWHKTVELAIPEDAKAFHMRWISHAIQYITPDMFRQVRTDVPTSING